MKDIKCTTNKNTFDDIGSHCSQQMNKTCYTGYGSEISAQ